MPKVTRRGQRRRLIALAGAIAMVGAGCGGAEIVGDTTAQGPAADGVGTGPAADEGTSEAPEAPGPSESSNAGAETNLFPDIEVVNISDSSTVNLSTELAGGDLPVLLWFWAPH
ncbi:MAG: hypothetical protein GY724_23695 [Actinomycetia bacterium]|nr:hypothetical protein [Actinomycetes bacterium]MCP4225077.1 hypothetical protein [Actinomycetes bacterium]MCP5031719.1 hypothetical protein [Actinomycetes bacterium]